jgi:hypothetical protein
MPLWRANKVLRSGVLFAIAVHLLAFSPVRGEPRGPGCQVVRSGSAVELSSAHFVFRLSTANGLRAEWWLNRMTGRKLVFSGGPEVEFDIGLPGEALRTPRLKVVKAPPAGPVSEAEFELASDEPQSRVSVRYRWDSGEPVLRKLVTITNADSAPWERLLNVRLGSYETRLTEDDADHDFPVLVSAVHDSTSMVSYEDPAGRERGYPAYLAREFFLSLAHPAGWAVREGSKVTLRHYPGRRITPGGTFECMEAVYGVSRRGQARASFRDHLATRMRRVVRKHNRPYAIFEPFGGWPEAGRGPAGLFWEDEKTLLDLIGKVAEGQRRSGCHFDILSIDFWHDSRGDLKHPDAERFPNGFEPILRQLRGLGTAPGLWVDSGGIPAWTLGKNPDVQNAYTSADGKGKLCFATDPIARLYTEAFLHHVRDNGVRLLKFDNFGPGTLEPECNNPRHEHLPGIYSTEAIDNAAIGFYRALENEDVFLMLYWAYRSPWWLLYGDTVFDSGTRIEGASFAAFPAPRARDSTTRRLDQARWVVKDLPPLGWDTLGVWLSDWAWNSRIGKSRWQSGVVMDMCRGHLLAQIWSDPGWLSPPERREMADFASLLQSGAERFRNCRFIYGNPWKNEPYGYVCPDGKRAFVAINNGIWSDRTFDLELNSAWGLPDGKRWDVYRWYPHPARLLPADRRSLMRRCQVALRPFEIVLLEITPAGEAPALERALTDEPLNPGFTEASRAVEVVVSKPTSTAGQDKSREFTIQGHAPATRKGGLMTLSAELRAGNRQYWTGNQRRSFSGQGSLGGREVSLEPVLIEGYPAPWQAWRIPIAPSTSAQPFELRVTTSLPREVGLVFEAHFVPGGLD